MFFLFAVFFACRPSLEFDAAWTVTVTGLETSCLQNQGEEEMSGFQKSYQYDLVQDGTGTRAKIYIDNTMFATGDLRGCSFQYKSSAYLEDSSDGRFTWDITGDADIQLAAGGCVEDQLDWKGTEVLTVLESENPSVEVGCTYTMSVEGTFIQE